MSNTFIVLDILILRKINMKNITIIVTIALIITNISVYANWRHIARQPGNFSGSLLQDRLSDDNIIIYNYSEKIYKSTDQGKSWFEYSSISRDFFDNNLRFHYPNENIQFFNHNAREGMIGSNKYHKRIYKVSNNYKNIQEVFYLGPNADEYSINGLYMLDTNFGLVKTIQNLTDDPNEYYKWKESFYITKNGWVTSSKIDIPLYFQFSGLVSYKFKNGELLFHSGQPTLKINNNDTIIRGAMGLSHKGSLFF